MATIINKNGKKVKPRFLPKMYCGDRLPQECGEYVCRGETTHDSLWNNYTIDEVMASDGLYVWDGDYLTLIS